MKQRSPFTLIVAFTALSLVGLALLPLLPIKLNPSRTLPGFTVQFSMKGASARVVEMEATGKLEAMLSRIKGVKRLTSTSSNGSGRITVEVDKHADLDVVRFEASTVIRQTWGELPQTVSYPSIRMRMPEGGRSGPFLSYTLNAPATPLLIQQYAEEHIKPRLAQLKGVYKVDVSGATPMEWRLVYDSNQLRTLGITPDDIRNAISLYYRKEFMGTYDMETPAGRQWIRLALVPEGQAAVFDPERISVTASNGSLVRLDELLTVTRAEEKPQSYYRINGLNSVYLSITAEESANQLQLGDEITARMEMLRTQLPAGYEVHTRYDATDYIRAELNKIYFRTALTVLILLLFVFVITLSWKYLFLIVTSLTVNLCVAFICYYLFGLEMQLYSLAGITVSLNLIIDSTIVMTDHLLHRRNLKAFLSILAATLTTVGALVMIFFLDDKIRLNLQDFAAVMIINLTVSLFVALFFVPALIEKIGMRQRPPGGKQRWRKRAAVRFTRSYTGMIQRLMRARTVVCIVLILAFGLPVFLLPEKWEGESRWAQWYNQTLGTTTYKEKIKPVVDIALGGTLRLFVQKVYEGSYFSRNDEVVLSVAATLPNGSTLEQMNTLIKRLEVYLSGFKEISRFQTSISSARRASIQIYFQQAHRHDGFPYTLKSDIIGKVQQLGGGEWSVYGLEDHGFSNSVRESAGSYRVKMYGYNYDDLAAYADSLKALLLTHRRIREVTIRSEFSWYKDDYEEFSFRLHPYRMRQEGITAQQLFANLRPVFSRNENAGSLLTDHGTERMRLLSKQSDLYDVWAMQFFPMLWSSTSSYTKLSELATAERSQTPHEIVKENQQYRLCLQYEYVGSYEQGRKSLARDLQQIRTLLPMGYSAEDENNYYSWGKEDNRQYVLLLMVIAIIFVISAILFDSLKQPLAIIFVIPLSYIGVFLTFYWFRLNFDQGGFASFVLLCGITVNASIYILNEFNHLRRRFPHLSPLRAYVKAWNAKIIPIFLTVVSTILGFIPFMVGTAKESFWFPLAAGTIGGLVMSVIVIFFCLPLFCLKKPKGKRVSSNTIVS
ncbi:MAG: efflux RND transporter permease subunit [Prevotellaceae bacterium]|jgi:multidrug efflux pump subunit AcrB|nr:efflux RND transporter permease subunit [Prevotellaceae bacterium]